MATSNKDLKAIMAARREGRLKPTPVPQVDPVEALGVPAADPELPAAQPPPTTPTAQAPAQPVSEAPAAPAAAPGEPNATTAAVSFNPFDMLVDVDTTEQLRMAGFHMYPSRHEQLGQLAFLEKRRQWQIVEEALADYVKKHYGKKRAG